MIWDGLAVFWFEKIENGWLLVGEMRKSLIFLPEIEAELDFFFEIEPEIEYVPEIELDHAEMLQGLNNP